jgi:amidase
MTDQKLWTLSARDLYALLVREEITPLDTLDALEQRVAAVDPIVNALPTLCFDRARDYAKRLMTKPISERGALKGIPVAIKDLTEVQGVRSTHGSPIFAHHVPQKSDLMVERLEAEGALIYAKSNTPEFGAGAHTFNPVFGATRNPWNTALSAAGSSGGAAVALATGMAWLAQGSDFGGSLRNPASFNNVVGLRPTPGRVAYSRKGRFDSSFSVEGPMARTVADLAFFLDAMTGDDRRDPISKPRPAISFLDAALSRRKPLRIAFSEDLGITPVDPRIRHVLRGAIQKLTAADFVVEEVHPDVSDAAAIFHVLRANSYALSMSELLRTHRDQLKPDIVWNIEAGLALSPDEVRQAELARTALMQRVADFFGDFDVLLCPATIVPPFPIDKRYVDSCDGHVFSNYIEWLTIVSVATLAGCPALSLPCGFTDTVLPVGLQMIGPANGEASLLSAAGLFEEVFALDTERPIDPRSPA